MTSQINRVFPFTGRELAAVLAGLRLLQREGSNIPPAILDILCEAGSPLEESDIDALCEEINCATIEPRADLSCPKGGLHDLHVSDRQGGTVTCEKCGETRPA